MNYTEAENYILNYPIKNLSILSEKYFGYPDHVLHVMLHAVSPNFNYSSSKIAVLNDFGFQIVKYLLSYKSIKLDNVTILVTNRNLIDIFIQEFSWTGLNIKYVGDRSLPVFDLLIANPPYSRSVTNPLLRDLKNICKEAVVLYLTSFCAGLGKGDPQSREALDNFINDITHYGYFSKDVHFDVSVYHLLKNQASQEEVFENFLSTLRSPEELSIRKKISGLPKLERCWFKENFGLRVKADNYEGKVQDWMEFRMQQGERFINCSCYQRNKASGIVLHTAQTYACTWLGPKEMLDNLSNETYKYLALMFSNNKRDQHGATLAKLPIELPEFTEEEMRFLKNLDN